MKIEILGKQYEADEEYEHICVDRREYIPLKIFAKNNELKDMLLCVDMKTGCRECFYRMDIGRELKEKKMSKAVAWTKEERQFIKEALKNGLSTREISKLTELNRHTEPAIRSEVLRIKTKIKFEENKPRFNIKF